MIYSQILDFYNPWGLNADDEECFSLGTQEAVK